jgi:hypothetical protein
MIPGSINVKRPILTQPQFCAVAGIDMVTANNWVARNVLSPSQVGERQVKGTRLYSLSRAYEGRIISELVRLQKIQPSDAAKVAELATKGGWIEHWARALEGKGKFVTAYMVVAWADDCYDSQIINGDKDGLPDFSVKEMKRFLGGAFIVLPLTTIFTDVYKRYLAIFGVSS